MIPAQIEQSHTTLLKNRIYKSINGFHCHLCDKELTGEQDAYTHITNDEKHIEQMTSDSLKNLRLDDEKSTEFVNNGIVPIDCKGYKCTLCSCLIPKLDHVSEHINCKKHVTKRRIVLGSDLYKIDSVVPQDKDNDSSNDQKESHFYDSQNDNERKSCSDGSVINNKDQDKNRSCSYGSPEDQKDNKIFCTPLSDDEDFESYRKNNCSNNDQFNVQSNVHCNLSYTKDTCVVESYSDNIQQCFKADIKEEIVKNLPNDQMHHISNHYSIDPNIEHRGNSIEPFLNCPIVGNDFALHCNYCNGYLESESALLYHRMFHLSQRSCTVTDIINFSMKQNVKSIYCLVCDYVMYNEDDLEKHLNHVIHQKRLVVLCCPNNSTITNMVYLNSTIYQNFAVPPDVDDIYNNLSAAYNRYLQCLGYSIYHSTPQPAAQNTHINIGYNEHQILNTNILPLQPEHSMQYFFCFVCCIKFMDENLLFSHYNDDYFHKYRMEAILSLLNDKHVKFVSHLNNEVLKCFKCQVYLAEVNIAIQHLSEMQHTMEIQVELQKPSCSNTVYINDVNVPQETFVCPICKINVVYDYMMVQHLESDYHKHRMKEYYANINSESFEKIIFFCHVCKMNFFNDTILLDHFYDHHQNTCKKLIEINSLNINTNDSYFSTNTLRRNNSADQVMQKYCNIKQENPVEMNYAQINAGNINSSKNHHQLTAKIDQQKSFNQNSGTISNTALIRTKTLIIFSPRYVKLCVETGEENIFKISPEKLKKLHLSVSLTFPFKSKRVCIPCGYEILDDPQLLFEHFRTEEHEKNLQEMEEYDEFFENYRDQFSDLQLAKQYMCEVSDKWVKCFACDTKIKNLNRSLYNHINSKSHKEKYQPWKQSADKICNLFSDMFENLWYYIETFVCNICSEQFDFEVDYARHLENQKHMKEVEKRILKKQSLQFDCCIICSNYWYGKSDQHALHCSKESHKYILTSRDFNVPKMPESVRDILNSVNETVNVLIEESNEVINSKGAIENELLESVETVVKSKYPNARAYLFGSRISYLGIKDSDLDIYLDCENQYEKLNSMDKCEVQLLAVQECFHKYQDIWIIEEIILRTRVPIIKVRHRPTNLNCDISFINGLSVEKSKVVGYFTNACSCCRKLILFLKKWNTLCKLSVSRGITTFATSWLVIFYLQIRGIVPSVWHLIKLNNQSNIVAGWETGISKKIPVENIDLSIEQLLFEFFSYYAEFDYISDVACPFLGKVMKKSQYSHIDDLPEEMNLYKSLIKREKIEFFRLDSPMCIQEPIDLSQNLTKAVSKLHLRMFKQYCADSAKLLQQKLLI